MKIIFDKNPPTDATSREPTRCNLAFAQLLSQQDELVSVSVALAVKALSCRSHELLNSVPLRHAALMAYPVVVFLHGESFEWGSSILYDGSVLAALGKVIVVTLNYRLGLLGKQGSSIFFLRLYILGFYNANTDPVGRPTVANYGLMDQLAALHWVQENIVRFGGDPGQVTVMGHGTGAACLNFLVISPAATGQSEIMLAITAEYTDWSRSLHQPISIRDSTGQGLHDANIVSPMADIAKQLYTNSRSSYLYVLGEEVADSGKESLLLKELAYVFGGPLGALGPLASSYNFTKMDVTFSKSFISMWSNFIKLGYPKDTVSTAKMSESANDITSEEQIWPKYDPVYQRYFRIGQYNFTEAFLFSPITPTLTGPANTPHNLTIVAKANKNQVSESPNLDRLSQMGKDFPYTTALSVTVAIACSLLILNILALTTIYYRHKANRCSLTKGSQDVNSESGNDVQLHSSGDNSKTIYGPGHYGTLRPSITMRSNLATAFEEESQHDWLPDYMSSVQTIDNRTGVTSNMISPDTQRTITNTQTLHEQKGNILSVTTLKQPVASYTSPNDGQLDSTYLPVDGQLVSAYLTKENQLIQNYSPNAGQTVTSYSQNDGKLIPNYLSISAFTIEIRE
ncbi:neuroligin-4, Y-linked-like [Palaemon carinicauda]|uniref:neuroligin-4, Y-linked-like n=1 Tax=Palaemon carinicauda TaxID=392227 RepID=UPI0035B686F3